VGRGVTLGAGQSHLAGADVRVPGGVTGNYSWVVVGNSQADVFEGANSGNNEATAMVASSLTVPLIPLDGAPLATAFNTQEEEHWFQCLVPVGRDVRFDLDLLAGEGVTSCTGAAFMPNENHSASGNERARHHRGCLREEQVTATNGRTSLRKGLGGLSATPQGSSALRARPSAWSRVAQNRG
jgi:hypothetical protein